MDFLLASGTHSIAVWVITREGWGTSWRGFLTPLLAVASAVKLPK